VIRELRVLLRLRDFRKLFLVRLVSQAGDGAFQVGLATLLFFSPASEGTARDIAAGFAVLFAPFVVAPFVGVLLDRWRRRQVLLYANLVRGAVTVVAAIVMFTIGGTRVVTVVGLIALAINRFILSGLSAGLPNVLLDPRKTDAENQDLLLTANSIVPTLGSAATGVGGAIGLVLNLFLPAGNVRNGAALVFAGALMVAAAFAATRLAPGQLGPFERTAASAGAPSPDVAQRAAPDAPIALQAEDLDVATPVGGQPSFASDLRQVFRDLAGGAQYLARRVTPGQGLLAMAWHRFLFGVVTIATILMSRNLFNPGDQNAAIATFAGFIAAMGVGYFAAVVITPFASRYTGPQRWVGAMLFLATVSQALMIATHARALLTVCAFLLGVAAQGAKIAVDTIIQKDTHDEFRGRAFAFYDLMYNAAYTASAILGAFVVPDEGWSPPLFLVLAAGYGVGGVLMTLFAAHHPGDITVAQR
jgi:MFS family permease